MDPRILEVINSIEECGCDCDLLYGWYCSIHEKVGELKTLLDEVKIES